MKNFFICVIIAASIAVRFVGISLSLIQLESIALGLISLALFYKLTNSWVCLILLSFSPWHILFSKTWSPMMIWLNIFILFCIVGRRWLTLANKSLIIILIANILIPIFVTRSSSTAEMVRLERSIVKPRFLQQISPLFSNKFTVSAKILQKELFESLDIGNYFFAGHPRERWGYQELPKLYFILIPFTIIGLFKQDPHNKPVLIFFFLMSLNMSLWFKTSADRDFLMIVPLVILTCQGFTSIRI